METNYNFVKENPIMRGSVLDKIMTGEEYGRLEHSTPYTFRFRVGNKELNYFGSPHVQDPTDTLFVQIEEAFKNANPDIVFVEGIDVQEDVDKLNEAIRAASREQVIKYLGESGFTLKLCAKHGTKWRSPEPSDKDLYDKLLTHGFSKEQIFAWSFFQILPQYNRLMNKDGFRKYVEPFIDQFRSSTNWEEFDYSYEHGLQLGEQILGRSIEVENEPNALDYIDPVPWEGIQNQTILNRIGEESSRLRDRQIVSDLADALKRHNRIFVVYGASHAVMQEPALKQLFKDYEHC